MNPIPLRRDVTGIRMLIDARASVPTKLEMKAPSTMLYEEMKSIVAMEGRVNLSILGPSRILPRFSSSPIPIPPLFSHLAYI